MRGYILIELLISMLISGFITTGLFTSFYQLRTAMSTADYIASVHQRATLVYQQFDRDLGGAFKPVQAKKEKAEKKETPETKKTEKTDEQKKEKPLTYIFYGTVKEKQFELLTCITANPLQIYWSDRAGAAKPRIARVVYRLLKEKGEPLSYRLVRQESYKPLDWAAFAPETAKQVRQIELITGIKECTVLYTVAVEKKSDKSEGAAEKDQKKKKKKAYDYKESKEWKLSDAEKEKAPVAEDDKKKKEKKEPHKEMPDFVAMKLVLWDDAKVREVPFEFTWAVGRALVGDLEIEKEEEKKPEKKPEEQMPQTKEEAKQRFGQTMRKLNAFKEKTARMQQFALNDMPRPGVRRFAHNSMPGAPVSRQSHQVFPGVMPGAPVSQQGNPVYPSGVSVPQQAGEPTAIPGIVRVGDWVPPVGVNASGGAPEAVRYDMPPEYADARQYDVPPEIQEQIYGYYDDMRGM